MTPAIKWLETHGVDHRLLRFTATGSEEGYALEAARALGAEPGRVFKTLVVSNEQALGVVIVPANRKVALKKAATSLGWKKADMATPVAAERATGYRVGGISPFGQKKPLPLRLDRSAERFDRIFVSGGQRGLELEVSPAALMHAGAELALLADL